MKKVEGWCILDKHTVLISFNCIHCNTKKGHLGSDNVTLLWDNVTFQ